MDFAEAGAFLATVLGGGGAIGGFVGGFVVGFAAALESGLAVVFAAGVLLPFAGVGSGASCS